MRMITTGIPINGKRTMKVALKERKGGSIKDSVASFWRSRGEGQRGRSLTRRKLLASIQRLRKSCCRAEVSRL